jgi:hypothetical protein
VGAGVFRVWRRRETWLCTLVFEAFPATETHRSPPLPTQRDDFRLGIIAGVELEEDYSLPS